MYNTEHVMLSQKRDRSSTNYNYDHNDLIIVKPKLTYRSNLSDENHKFKYLVEKSTLGIKSNPNINGCNCKNRQCFKLYCEFFSGLQQCDPSICPCGNCKNTKTQEVIYIGKHPRQFNIYQSVHF
jgi:hypothetical protein